MCNQPSLEVLAISDVPAEYRDAATTVGVTVQITTQRTGFGYRRYFVCPSCGRKCGKLHRVECELHCQRCKPLDLYFRLHPCRHTALKYRR